MTTFSENKINQWSEVKPMFSQRSKWSAKLSPQLKTYPKNQGSKVAEL
jgi:hypothetical protein